MPATKHFLKHPARKVVALLILYFDTHGAIDFDEFDENDAFQ